MANPPPNVPTVPLETLAHLFNVTTRRVQQLVKDGVIPPPVKRGQYLLADSVRGYVRWLQERVQHRDAANVTRDLREEQLRKIKLENDLAEQATISIDEMIETVGALGQLITRLCEALPGRLTPMLVPYLREDVDPSILPGVITGEQRRIRAELSSAVEGIAGVESPGESDSTATTEDTRPVGRREQATA